MAKIDKTYHNLLEKILREGYKYEDPNRKGINRIQISDATIKHDFKDGFPAVTTKKLYWKGVVTELLWFLRGDTNIKYLVDNNINIWNKDAYNYYVKNHKNIPTSYDKWLSSLKNSEAGKNLGDLGRIYGAQWRNWKGKLIPKSKETISPNHHKTTLGYKNIDQIADLIKNLKEKPMATKKTVTFWNPAEKDQCALTPCHWSFEILVEPIKIGSRMRLCDSKKLEEYIIKNIENCKSTKKVRIDYMDDNNIPKYQFTLKWHQHSVDTFLGLPFNIASYALLAHVIGKMTNMVPKGIIGDLSNVHIYEPHLDAVKEQLSRNVNKYDKCELKMDTLTEVYLKDGLKHIDNNNIVIGNFKLDNYESYPSIKAEMLAYNN